MTYRYGKETLSKMTYHEIILLFNVRIMSPNFPIHMEAQTLLQACTNIINLGIVF